MSDQPHNHITIKRSVPEDAPGLAYVQALSWFDTYRKDDNVERTTKALMAAAAYLQPERIEMRMSLIERAAANPDDELYLTATYGNTIRGVLYGTKTAEHQEIQVLYVAHEARQRGIGRALINTYLQWSDPTKPVELGVVTDNVGAQTFYEHMGFRLTDEPERNVSGHHYLREVVMKRETEQDPDEILKTFGVIEEDES